ncbi:MAG TPA: hypothetical protein VN328_12600 [Thermodesulfovibrionales bacterium]|nr:hypothetical protein [Thermodesulfovibrionales bacterium]
MKIFLVPIVFFAGIAFGSEIQAPQNLLRREMAALDRAFKATVDAIVLNEPEKIGPAFSEVNAIRGEVEHAVKGHAKLALPRNQKRYREFVRLDDKFHHELTTLLKAAKKKNMLTVRRQTHRLLDLCVRCHVVFRK